MAGSLVYNIPRFLAREIVDTPDGRKKAVPTAFGASGSYRVAYQTATYHTVIYILPFTALIAMTYCLLGALRESNKRRFLMTQKAINRAEITRTLLAVIIVYMICNVFNPIRRLLVAVLDADDQRCGSFYYFYQPFAPLMTAFNASINFFIYCLGGRRFRNLFHERVVRKIQQLTNKTTSFTLNNRLSLVHPFES